MDNTQTNFTTSPDWSDAPDWAEWFAIDASGSGYWYSDEPKKIVLSCDWLHDFGNTRYAGDFDASDWENSLQPRPIQYEL